jgi:hypothetical protein
MRIPALVILGSAALFAFGCASKEEPAKQALASAEAALNEVKPDAAKFAPDRLQTAEADLAMLKRDFSNEKYKTVLLHAPDVNKEVGALKEIVVAKQTQVAAATREWEELSEEVPKLVDAIQTRVNNLPASKREPAKTDLAQMKTLWTEANAAFDAGNATEAADKGRQVQMKAKDVSEKLGVSPV